MSRTVAELWARYWREVERGGMDPARRPEMRDAFAAGALSALARAAELEDVAAAWRETARIARGENMAELALFAGIEPIDPPPPRGICS